MDLSQKQIAYYHLPGLFEFYELYSVFLPLFRAHREYFYDWCRIGSVYGAPVDCLWGGGRTSYGEQDPRAVLALMQEYGISARLTFSNSLLKEEHLKDHRCNALCRKLLKYARKQKIAHGEIFLTTGGRSMDRRQIWSAMKRLCQKAGVAPSKVFPHNLRHLFATAYYRVYHDIVKLADMLGHSSIETTRIYLIESGAEHQRQLERLGLVS